VKTAALTPFFLDGTIGQIFCLSIAARNSVKSASPVLFIPPFAEEMNKSRHLFRSLAQLLAESGIESIIFDLFGTGDSEGDFGEASWDIWVEDLRRVHQWLIKEVDAPVSILSLRAGALLAADYIQRYSPDLDRLILLAPVVKGENFLSQFLRLRIAAEMSENTPDKATLKSLKEDLQSGKSVEIAGYSLSPPLAKGMMNSAIYEGIFQARNIRIIDWIELLASEDRPVPVVHKQLVEQMAAADLPITLHKFCGPAFWSAAELVELPNLLLSIRNILRGK
jgi:exosortase A-associated hydrolase 2